jgi:Cu-Zn family superoxide dismutase
MRYLASFLIGASAVVAACGEDKDADGGGVSSATATFVGTSGQTVAGTARFTEDDGEVTLEVTITAAPPGTHGIHIHQVPACGNGGMDAGPHWDDRDTGPANHHLPPDRGPRDDHRGGHLGDLGNITIAADGTGELTFSNPAWTLGDGAPTDVLPHAIIFHQMLDDGSMPSAGARWGCAVIVAD